MITIQRFTALILLPIVFGVAVVAGFSRLRIDNSPSVWLDARDPAVQYWRSAQETFGRDEFILFAGLDRAPFDEDSWNAQRKLTAELENDDRVESVISLPVLLERLGRNAAQPPNQTDRQVLMNSPIVRGRLIAPDGKSSVVIARVRDGDSAWRSTLANDMRALAESHGGWMVAGPTIFNAELDDLTTRDLMRLVGWMVLVLLVAGGVILRSAKGIAAIMIGSSVPIVAWLALLGLRGESFSAVESTALPLLAVIGMENTVHLWFGARDGMEELCPFTRAARRLSRALFLANATTALSLIGLAASHLTMLQTMGWTLPFGVLTSWGMTRVVLPGWLDAFAFRPSNASGDLRLTRCVECLYRTGTEHRFAVIGAAFIVMLVGGWCTFHLQPEANIAQQLDPSTRLAQETATLDKRLGGSLPLLVDITPVEPAASALITLGDGERLAQEIRDKWNFQAAGPAELLSLVQTLGAVRSEWNEALERAGAHDDLFRTFRWEAMRDAQCRVFWWNAWDNARIEREKYRVEIPGFLVERTARVEVLAPQMSSVDVASFAKAVQSPDHSNDTYARTNRTVTGMVALMLRAQERILGDQIAGIAVSIVLVLVCMKLFFPKQATIWLLLPANILPLAMVAFSTRIINWPVDLANMQLASMLFGFVVNSTIFLLAQVLENKRPSLESKRAIFRHTGSAILSAGIITAAVFFCAVGSQFISLRHVGVLSVFAIAGALLGDLVVLPAMLNINTESPSGKS